MTALAPPPGYRGAFRTDADALACYSESAGIGRAYPVAVARPDDVESVATLVEWAAANRLPLIPRGSGSSMAGGAIGEGVIVDLGALDTVGPVDRVRRAVRAGAGAIRDDVDRAARTAGLRFTVDPSSGAFCTIGGMVATNAAGARSLAHGAMRSSVTALDCIFADGSRATVRRGEPWSNVPALRRLHDVASPALSVLLADGPLAHAGVRKESSGYAIDQFAATGDVVDLLVGSEGTLCIVTAAELSLRELPAATASVLATFDTLEDAVAAAGGAADAGAVACELLDRTFLDLARSAGHARGIPAGADAVLLAEVESPDGGAGSAAAALGARFRACGATVVHVAMEPVAEAELWEIRHAASPTIARLHPASRSMQFIEDGAVPPEAFARYVRGVRDALVLHGLTGVIFGHAGDAHAHVNPLVDVADPRWRAQVEGLLADVTRVVAALGGTLSAEHGDGRLRTPLLDRVWPRRALDAFALVKRALDPDGLLNPGVKVPLPGQQAIGAVKYDPSAAPLPRPAAAVLQHVERTRAYGRSRLALLEELA